MGHALGHSAKDVDANLRNGADIIASLRKGARPSASQLPCSVLAGKPAREPTPRCVFVAPPQTRHTNVWQSPWIQARGKLHLHALSCPRHSCLAAQIMLTESRCHLKGKLSASLPQTSQQACQDTFWATHRPCVLDRHEEVPAPAQSCTSLHRPVPLKLADPSALQTLSKAHKAASSRSSHSSPQQSAEDADEYVMSLLRDASHNLLHLKAQSQQQPRQQARWHPTVSKRKRSAAAAKPPDKQARRCLATAAVTQLGSAPWQQARELLMSQQQQFAQQVSS